MNKDLNTPEGMLRHLLYRNQHGVWFQRVGDNYAPLSRWLWGHCELVMASFGPDASQQAMQLEQELAKDQTGTGKTCYGCRHLTSNWFGDGTTIYGCDLLPGLVKGSVSAFEDDEPMACEKYER